MDYRYFACQAEAGRILLARWTAIAWKKLQAGLLSGLSVLVPRAWIHTGWLLTKDGSEDNLVQLQRLALRLGDLHIPDRGR